MSRWSTPVGVENEELSLGRSAPFRKALQSNRRSDPQTPLGGFLPFESTSRIRAERNVVVMAQDPMWVSSVTVSAPNPRELARFYERLLEWEIIALEGPRPGEPSQAGWAQLRAPAHLPGLRTINIEYEQQYIRPTWPSQQGRQHITVHLDLPVADLDAAHRRAVDAGAITADHQPQEGVRVMIDPAGHPFCLFQA